MYVDFLNLRCMLRSHFVMYITLRSLTTTTSYFQAVVRIYQYLIQETQPSSSPCSVILRSRRYKTMNLQHESLLDVIYCTRIETLWRAARLKSRGSGSGVLQVRIPRFNQRYHRAQTGMEQIGCPTIGALGLGPDSHAKAGKVQTGPRQVK
jgi:hypothetical protein